LNGVPGELSSRSPDQQKKGYTMHNWLRIGAFGICIAGVASLAQAQGVPPEVLAYPDTILHNAKIAAMDDRGNNQSPGTMAEAIAVRDGRILAIGRNADILRLAGPQTERVDVGGRTIIPGIIDAHTHIHNHAADYWMEQNPQLISQYWRNFEATGENAAELKRSIQIILKERAAGAPASQWIFIDTPSEYGGTGLGIKFVQDREMTVRDLDELSPTNPVIVGAHPVYIINSAAKKAVSSLYGGGPVSDELIDEDGIGSAVDLVRALLVDSYFRDKVDKLAEILADGMAKQAALGTTAFSSHIIGLRFWDAYIRLDRERQMPIRFAYTHYFGFQANEDPSAFYMRLGDQAGIGSDYLYQSGMGLMSVDSGPPRFCTSMEAPEEIKKNEWCKAAPGTRVHKAIQVALANRQRIAVGHMYADRGLDFFMDQLEYAIENEPGITLDYIRSRRFTADHCGFHPRPDQIPRIVKLGMVISCEGAYLTRSYPSLQRYGMQYANWVAPARGILDGGGKVVFEAEVRVESGSGPTLFSEFMPFLTRKNARGQEVAPEQAVDRVRMLKMATTWGSEFMMKEGDIGTLEKGKLADLLVLNKDYFTVPLEQVPEVYPVMTMVGGKVVVLREEFASQIGRSAVGPQLQFRGPRRR
jgi:predicted amidohydrolase YtcJ